MRAASRSPPPRRPSAVRRPSLLANEIGGASMSRSPSRGRKVEFAPAPTISHPEPRSVEPSSAEPSDAEHEDTEDEEAVEGADVDEGDADGSTTAQAVVPAGPQLPAEIINRVCEHLYWTFRAPDTPDPILSLAQGPASYSSRRSATTDNPAFAPPAHDQARQVFANLCLVCSIWRHAARPWLWRDVRVNVPRFWIKLLQAVTGTLDGEPQDRGRSTIDQLLTPPHSRDASPNRADLGIHDRRLEVMLAAFERHERERNPRRGRSVSAGSVRSMSTVSSLGEDALEDAADVGLLIQTLSFSRFRSTGMHRSARQGSQQRFVTAERLLSLLRGTRAAGELDDPNVPSPDHSLCGRLSALGFTEYCDSSVSAEVLGELLLRGGMEMMASDGVRQAAGTALARATAPIVALDLCGCVSARFGHAVDTFLAEHGWAGKESDSRTVFPHLRRLGLHSVALAAPLLTSFVSAFPSLTHLDLTSTRASPALLMAMGATAGMRLQALSLALCRGLTSDSIVDFLLSDVASTLTSLSLYGDPILPTPMSCADLRTILTEAPCMTSGRMRSLDIGSCPLQDEMLDLVLAQPHLIDLGIAWCSMLSYAALARFLIERAPRVEVLDLVGSCAQRANMLMPQQTVLDLHRFITEVATIPPPPLSAWAGLQRGAPAPQPDLAGRKTHLRVIELDERTLDSCAGGASGWRVIFGKGRRGWYVDTTIGIVDQAAPLDQRELRVLQPDDPDRRVLELLNKLEGAVPSETGWHPRKLEILQGQASFGREDGLWAYCTFQRA